MGITSRMGRIFIVPVAVIALCASFQAHSEDPFKTDLDASNARDFLGTWAVSMDMMGRVMEMEMKLVDIDGKVGGTFDTERSPEPVAIEEMAMLDDGALQVNYNMSFGSQSFSITVTAELTDDGLAGEFVEKSGLFKAPFTAKEAVDDVETRDQRRRNRRMSATAATLRFDQDKIRITFAALKTESKDYESFKSLSNDTVFEYVGGRASKILSDIDLHFGDTVIKQGNAYESYPGVYSIWMKKTAKGWNLVFNEEADVWGTMFNPETQVYEVPMTESAADETAAEMKVTLEKVGENGGRLNILWADKKYSAEFTTGDKKAESPS